MREFGRRGQACYSIPIWIERLLWKQCSRALQCDAPKMFQKRDPKKKRDPKNQMLVSHDSQTFRFCFKTWGFLIKTPNPYSKYRMCRFIFTTFPSSNYDVCVCFLDVWSDSFLSHQDATQECHPRECLRPCIESWVLGSLYPTSWRRSLVGFSNNQVINSTEPDD